MDGIDRVSSYRAMDKHGLAGHDGHFIHRSDEWQSVDVEPGGMVGMADFTRRQAFVEATVVGVNGRDVQVRNDFVATGCEMSNLNPIQLQILN